MNECNNVNEIIRVSLKSLTDTVKNQGLAIRDLSKKLSNKPSREEIDNYLKFKPNNEDVFQAINDLGNSLEQKMDKNEFMNYLNQKNNIGENNYGNQYNELMDKFEKFKNDIFSKINKLENEVVKKDDFAILKNELDNKANIIDMESALEAKEDKEKINFITKNIVDKTEINNMINNAINKNKKIGNNDFEQFLNGYQNDLKNLDEKLNNKLDINDFQNVFENMKQRVDNIDNDLDRLIQSVKDQFQAVNFALNNLEDNCANKNDIIINMENILGNKIEKEQVDLLITRAKNNLLDVINQFKSGENSNMKIFEENIQAKMDKMLLDNQSLLNEITNTNQNINNYFSQKQVEMDSLMEK